MPSPSPHSPPPKSQEQEKGKSKRKRRVSPQEPKKPSKKQRRPRIEPGWYIERTSARGSGAAKCKCCHRVLSQDTDILRVVHHTKWFDEQGKAVGDTASSYCLLPTPADPDAALSACLSSRCFANVITSTVLRMDLLTAPGGLTSDLSNGLRRIVEQVAGCRRGRSAAKER